MIRKNEGLNCVCLASEPCQAGYNEIQRRKFCKANPTVSDPLPAVPEVINLSIRNAEKRLSREDLLFCEDTQVKNYAKAGTKNDLFWLAEKRFMDELVKENANRIKYKIYLRKIAIGVAWALHPTLGNKITYSNRITAVLHSQNRIQNRLTR